MSDGTKIQPLLSHDTGRHKASDEDHGLVSLSKNGDTAAFERLVRKYQKKVFNTAFRITDDYEEASDIVQDAFISAYRSIKGFREEAGFLTWLTAITINLSRNRLKKLRSVRGHEMFSIGNTGDTGNSGMTIDPKSEEPSAVEQAEKEDVSQKVRECLDKLESGFREIIVLRDIQDFSYTEIGVMLKLPEGTVKSRLSRARESVKDCLKNRLGEL